MREINSGVRGSNDYQEIGENNASIRSIVSYNTDSKVTNVLRSNGVLLAHVAPMGDLIEGSSSIVQLDAWNYEDAAYKTDIGMFINMPTLMPRRGRGGQDSSKHFEQNDSSRSYGNFNNQNSGYQQQVIFKSI